MVLLLIAGCAEAPPPPPAPPQPRKIEVAVYDYDTLLPRVREEPPARVPEPVEDASQKAITTVALIRPALRGCYARALATDPAIQGKLTVSVEVDGEGQGKVDVQSEGLPAALVECVTRVVRHALRRGPAGMSFALPIYFSAPR